MYLKRLELQGFKSFADKTVLEFRKGITSVIGPNGSGKSNIADAIRWVLGEQSIKSLRGSKSLDIIFSGTQTRKSLGFAEASLVFDNEDGVLPIEYTEVTVSRKIYRSGETGYFINKVPCRLKDVQSLFMDTGIGKDGYSIIGQGKIDEILSNKSEDRRHVFEEAAGIVKYRVRKQETEKKLERTKLNLLRINDILVEIESNIEPLKVQAEKAKKYLNLREELKNIEVGLFLYNIEKNKEESTKVVEDIKIIEDNLSLEENKLEEVKKIREVVKEKIDSITNKIEELSNIGFESEKNIEKLNSDINVAYTKIEYNNENEKMFEKEIEELKIKIEELKTDIKQKEEKKESLKSNKEKFVIELAEKEKELEKITVKLSSKALEIEDKKKQVEKNVESKYNLQTKLSEQKANIANLEKREGQLKQEIELNILDLDKERLVKEELSKKFYEIENKKSTINDSLSKIYNKKQIKEDKIKEFDFKINKISSDIRLKESRLKFLEETENEKEGYIKSVKALLKECEVIKELGKGVHGVLANIIKVPKEYEVAIEMCLGASVQNIVTDTEQDAKKLVEYLRKNNLGRASFLPISAIKGKKLDKIKGKEKGVLGLASNLVEFDKKYEQIILNLLGRTVVVDCMETAINVAKQNLYSFRIVTIEGDIINPSGSITGGSVAKKTVNILSRKREIVELKKEIKILQDNLVKEEELKKEYILNSEKELKELEGLEVSLKEIEIDYATEKQKITIVEENIEKLQSRLNKLKEENKNILSQKEQLYNIQKEEQEKIEELLSQNDKLQKVIDEFASLNKDEQKYIDNLNYDITNLKISVNSFDESESSIEEIFNMINQDIEKNQKNIQSKEEKIAQLKEENKNLEKEIFELKENIEKIKSAVKNSGKNIESLKEDRIKQNNILQEKEKEQLEKVEIVQNLKEQELKLEAKKEKLEEDLNHIINTMWDEYELTPNAITEYEKPKNINATQTAVKELRSTIRDLGSVNVDSIEEYKNLKDRYDFMCEQRVDLEETMNKLRKMINEMTAIMKEQFKEQFEIINKNFGEVFKELFGGGRATLTLEDEGNILESGININVQPPGKKLQNMLLLSGGERAFSAIALLFAILKINPSPFCVLDEIEAALDDVNVYRFADYLKKYTQNTQFLVITHRRGTMESADTVYGVTMEENGVSKLLSMKLK